jgi:MerR family redox-sensitive transcriptional activator SoxR
MSALIDPQQLLTISEVASRTGVASSALRFYEERGLIEAERNSSGHRRYRRTVLRRVAFIVFAQRLGYSLEEIANELAQIPHGRVPNGDDWDALTAKWQASINERIAELQRLERGLVNCIGCGCLSLDRCLILNSNDRVGNIGTGPRYWIDGSDLEEEPL